MRNGQRLPTGRVPEQLTPAVAVSADQRRALAMAASCSRLLGEDFGARRRPSISMPVTCRSPSRRSWRPSGRRRTTACAACRNTTWRPSPEAPLLTVPVYYSVGDTRQRHRHLAFRQARNSSASRAHRQLPDHLCVVLGRSPAPEHSAADRQCSPPATASRCCARPGRHGSLRAPHHGDRHGPAADRRRDSYNYLDLSAPAAGRARRHRPAALPHRPQGLTMSDFNTFLWVAFPGWRSPPSSSA